MGSAGLWDIYDSARGICRPVLFFSEATAAEFPELVEAAEGMFSVCVFAPDGLVEAVKAAGVHGVTTFHDDELDNADAALWALDLPGVCGVEQPWDKLVQRRSLARAGLSEIRATAVDTAEDFVQGLHKVGRPAVLKPRRAAGGSGLAFIEDPADVDFQLNHRQHWENMVLEAQLPSAAHPAAGWLADFVSVETVSTGDKRHHVAVFDKAPVSVNRRGGTTPGTDALSVTGDVTPTRLPDNLRDMVLEYTEGVLDALGVRWRVTHTELRLTPYGPELIEVNGRVGGHLSRLVREVGGPNMFSAALKLALGQDPEIPALPDGAPNGYAMGFFPAFRNRQGIVESNVTRADLAALPGVLRVDEVAVEGQPRSATGYRATNLVLRATDAAEMDLAIAQTTAGVVRLFHADDFADDRWFDNFMQN
ncbi:ATP-grasp domain-containing protein [Streptomyces goshikiensis]|uniref:ATP-grasp domain-containing protein n=1 Tax=Streptomyces goshikiensis TaxID=1942 RepID=UPI0036D017B8